MEEYNRTDEKHIVYHYCSIETFFNIIKDKKLWLSDSEYMNDNKEGIWIDEVVEKNIKELIETNPLQKEKLESLRDEYNKLEYYKHYFMSFSKNGDLLSQWRGYADDGYGVAIGFQSGLIFDILKIPPKNNDVFKLSGEKAKSNIFKFSYTDIKYKNNLIKDSIKEYLATGVLKDADIYALLIKNDAIGFKHYSFKEEKEFRIIYSPSIENQEFKGNKHLDNAMNKLSKKDYRVSNNQIIPYYKFDFSTDNNSLLIPKIILGSKCNLKIDDIQEFLISNGFESTKIEPSESSYR